jgi:hypothetical protein
VLKKAENNLIAMSRVALAVSHWTLKAEPDSSGLLNVGFVVDKMGLSIGFICE